MKNLPDSFQSINNNKTIQWTQRVTNEDNSTKKH